MNKNNSEIKNFFGEILDLSKMTVQVHNDLHNTTAYLWVNGENNTVAADEVDRVAQELCGMSDCGCHSVPTNGDRVVDANGDEWEII